MDYESVEKFIKQAGITQLAALLLITAEESIRKGCFVPGGASRSIANIEQRIAAEGGSGPHIAQQRKPKIISLTCGKCHAQYQLSEGAIHMHCGLNGCGGHLHFIG